jgi:hypothetical protein
MWTLVFVDKFSKVYNLVDFRNDIIFVHAEKLFNHSDNIHIIL